jgi:zinc protease
MTKVLTQPSFPADDFERVRRNHPGGAAAVGAGPEQGRQRALYRAVFGEHPYAATQAAPRKASPALTRDDLSAFISATTRRTTPPLPLSVP